MTIIIKPTFNCNFRCSYCYLSNDVKTDCHVMSIDLAKLIIEQIKDFISKRPRKSVTLLWHGGEPLLWGIDNFKQIFEYTDSFKDTVLFRHSIQTNLSLIDDRYITLFKEYGVRVGFSLDGIKSINDNQRKKADGSGTFDCIIDKVDKCRSAGLNVGAIIVASSAFKGRIYELYQFLRNKRLNFKFNPLFLSGEATNCKDLSLSPNEYAQMAIELFDLWFYDPEKRINESTFIDIASYFITDKMRTTGCMFATNCQQNIFAVSPYGEIFPCGRFCETDTRFSYGNINNQPLKAILANRKTSESYARFSYLREKGCNKCQFFNLCHGGCLHDGYLNGVDFKSKTFLCAAYKKIFKYIMLRMSEMFPGEVRHS